MLVVVDVLQRWLVELIDRVLIRCRKMLHPCRLLLWQVALKVFYHIVTASTSLCLGGSDIFASVRENSPMGHFISSINIAADPGANTVRLCLSGDNADWFYLDGRIIRLNSSVTKVLDREVQGSILVAELICYEDDIIQSRYRLLVEILNENDNRPNFLQETIQPFTVSELMAVNSVVFTVKAIDEDGDMISYIIDQSSPDAWFFRVDLPNSGSIVLDKALDYETRTHLKIILWAQESNTKEKFNTSAVLNINIKDGDDQYPHFLPCTPVSPGVPVCMNPTYTTNITQKHQDAVLEFSPGPIRAEDGDRGIDAPLIYSILSGGDQGRFVINNRTGEVRLTRPVDDRRQTPNFTLNVMVMTTSCFLPHSQQQPGVYLSVSPVQVCQVDDRLKYSVASVLVRVLYENTFPPVFNRTTFKGFIIQSSSPASIVSTYGNKVLQGLNPNVHYSLHPPSGLYQVTQGGVLIARTNRLNAFDRHILQVVARDEESGEEVSALVDVEVLQRGQTVPRAAFTEQPLSGYVDSRLAGGIVATLLLMFLSVVVFLLLRTVRRAQLQEPGDRSSVGKRPVNPPGFMDEYSTRAFSRRFESSSQMGSFHGRQGVYTRRLSLAATGQSADRTRTQLPASPERCRFQLDLFTVAEAPERLTWETLRSPDGTEAPPTDDITAANDETPRKDEDQSEDTTPESEKPHWMSQ
ncbi:cadherin-related family member 5 isoform X2 [Amphiprion ocellaris]|uniref:cadherin-related family member 5 isoform X2 n=1 Tax=Amphiprion ocellaris TaxID=80972 RepID=UPI00241155E5|nr:cadherin-related family member 5 isoform X2 [Amphiprion ocellaris]